MGRPNDSTCFSIYIIVTISNACYVPGVLLNISFYPHYNAVSYILVTPFADGALGLREIKELAQSHTTNTCQRQETEGRRQEAGLGLPEVTHWAVWMA